MVEGEVFASSARQGTCDMREAWLQSKRGRANAVELVGSFLEGLLFSRELASDTLSAPALAQCDRHTDHQSQRRLIPVAQSPRWLAQGQPDPKNVMRFVSIRHRGADDKADSSVGDLQVYHGRMLLLALDADAGSMKGVVRSRQCPAAG
eukprot:1551659-Rhodomonas_salina.4